MRALLPWYFNSLWYLTNFLAPVVMHARGTNFFTGRLRHEIQPLALKNHFDGKSAPFRIPFTEKWYPFQIPSLELCILFNCPNALSLNHKYKKFSRLFSQPQNSCCHPSFYRPKWHIFLPFYILQLVKSLPFNIPELDLKKVELSAGASPYRPL